jgi:UDP-GlcNAc:undecaprenyl-phosphate GlcNAc-1-phosphate transferase
MEVINLVILPFLIAAAIAYSATPFVIKLAEKIKIIDDPKTHKHPSVIHTYPIPRGGGLAIFLGILVSSIIFLPADKHLIGILLGGAVLVALGILDDKYNLNPYKRLTIQFLVAAIPIAAGIGIAFVKFPTLAGLFNKLPFLNNLVLEPSSGMINLSGPKIPINLFGNHSIWVLSDIFALFWIVTLMNFINIGASGLDGQLSGTVTIAALTIAALSLRYSADITQWPVIILGMITAGAYLGFLPWHFYPQKIMPGFGGSTLAGFMLGVLSILSTTKVGTLMVVLAVPLIDTGFVVFKRIASGKSPLWGDRGHFHHKLLDAGLSKRQVAIFYWSITALLGIIALNLNAESKFYTILGISVLLGGLILWLTHKNR